MKHITQKELDRLEPLLERLREIESLSEKKRGVFYLKSRAFLHFHEDPAGLFADVRLDGVEFARFDVTGPAEQRKLVARIREMLRTS